MEAEEYAELLSSIRDTFERVVDRHGGTIVQIIGDGALASFGYPSSREDDGRRAVEAALELRDAIEKLDFDLPPSTACKLALHSGIHSGQVLVEEGDELRGRLALFGNPVNVAARLSDAASEGQILVSEETLGADSHFFLIDGGRRLTLQGIPAPVAAFAVLGRAEVDTRFEARTKRGLTPFVGRAAELAFLSSRLDRVIGGKSQYVAVHGAAGIGKSRLLEEFLSRAARSGCKIYRGYCESYLTSEPLQPLIHVLRSIFSVSPGLAPGAASDLVRSSLRHMSSSLANCSESLLRALSLPAAPLSESESRGIDEVIAKLFGVLSAASPILLLIDDWQWSDDASRIALSAIRNLDRPIYILVATRERESGDVGDSNAEILHLEPFSPEETERVIKSLIPGRGKFVLENIRESAGGSPLFVEELCHSVSHLPRPDIQLHQGEAWLQKLIEARVYRLPKAQIELARAASIIGTVIPAAILQAITGCGGDHSDVRALADEDLIYPGDQPGTLRFKHGIAREVIYASVGRRQRREVHLAVAEALRQASASGLAEESFEPLAHHYFEAREFEKAARYAELAGDKAVAASALDRAQIQYNVALNALDLLPPDADAYERWMLIAQKLALACVFDPSRDQLQTLLRAVERGKAHGDRIGTGRAQFWAGYLYYALGQSRCAIDCLERALETTRQCDDDPLLNQISATLGQAFAAAGEYSRSCALLDAAIDVKRAQRKSNRPAVGFAYSLACKGSLLGDRGQFSDAYECFDEALYAVKGARHEVEGSILCWRSGVLLWQGRWCEAEETAALALSVAERVRSLYLYAMSRSLGGYASWRITGAPSSLQSIEDATSWLEENEKRLFISLNYGWLSEGMAATNDQLKARLYAARSLRRAREKDRIGEAMTLRALARLSAAGDHREMSEFYFRRAIDNAVLRGSAHELASVRLCQAEAAFKSGWIRRASAFIDEAEPAFEVMAMPWHSAQAKALRALL